MKKDLFSRRPSWWFAWASSFSAGWPKFIALGRKKIGPSSNTATKKWTNLKTPSFCLQLAFLFLVVAGFLRLGNEQELDPRLPPLLKMGWVWIEGSPCPLGEPGFYRLETETESVEFFLAGPERILSPPRAGWPEGNRFCTAIQEPSFIEEIP